MVPCAIEVHVALVSSEALAALNGVAGEVCGVELRALNALSHRSRAVRLDELEHVLLGPATVALSLRLDGADPPAAEGSAEATLHVSCDGTAHALVAWFDAVLDEEEPRIVVSTAPKSAANPSWKIAGPVTRAGASRWAKWATRLPPSAGKRNLRAQPRRRRGQTHPRRA